MKLPCNVPGRGAGMIASTVLSAVLGGCAEKEETGDMCSLQTSKPLPSTLGKPSGSGTHEKATFGAGCFWGVEAAFRQVQGVTSTAVGYSGGTLENPTYKDACSGKTGHAEVVEVVYDSSKVSYDGLLEVFWSIHDPTTPNRQGPDVGEQYRSDRPGPDVSALA